MKSILLILFISPLGLLACGKSINKPAKYLVEGYPIGRLVVEIEHPWIQDFIEIDKNKNYSNDLTNTNNLNLKNRLFAKYLDQTPYFNLKNINPSFYFFYPSFYHQNKIHILSEHITPYKKKNLHSIQHTNNTKETTSLSYGTGFIINNNNKSYVITNFHVVCCAEDIQSITFELHSKTYPLLKLAVKKVTTLNALFDTAILELKDQINFENSYELIDETKITSFNHTIGSLPTDNEQNLYDIEVRGFPDTRETLIQGKLSYFPPYTLSQYQSHLLGAGQSSDVCISKITDLDEYQGSSGSPVLIHPVVNQTGGTKKEIIGLVHGVSQSGNEITGIRATPSQIVSEIFKKALETNEDCRNDCFNQELIKLSQEFSEKNNPLATKIIRSACNTRGNNDGTPCPPEFLNRFNNSTKLSACGTQSDS